MRNTLLITTLLAGVAVATNAWALDDPAMALGWAEDYCSTYPGDCTITNGRITEWNCRDAGGCDSESEVYRFTYNNDNGNLIEYSYDTGSYAGSGSIKWDPTGMKRVEEYEKDDSNEAYTKYDATTGNKVEQYVLVDAWNPETDDYYNTYEHTTYNTDGYPIEVSYSNFSYNMENHTISSEDLAQIVVYSYETNDDGELVQIMSPGADWVDSGDDVIGRTTIYNTDGSIKSTIELVADPAIDDGAYAIIIDGDAQTYAVYSEETNTFLVCDYEVYPCSNPTGTYSSIANILKGITVADEEAANKPQSTRTQLADGSTRVVDPDGKIHYEGKRIYTIDEVNEVAGKTNSVKIRYR